MSTRKECFGMLLIQTGPQDVGSIPLNWVQNEPKTADGQMDKWADELDGLNAFF